MVTVPVQSPRDHVRDVPGVRRVALFRGWDSRVPVESRVPQYDHRQRRGPPLKPLEWSRACSTVEADVRTAIGLGRPRETNRVERSNAPALERREPITVSGTAAVVPIEQG